ncbi:protocatechuate 3,4-dioxygenase subunit beta [Burkholderia ubonensis]|uniref:Protocatechuate 3,4-dioxygenase subunit beta n=1 Tax=Burkholderia ubonensis TaxID=101571 RepID=A0A125KT33_9BURK|nr:protocatechuate 3,4-dioxygenase subunit beta [Burkholderia ubonensis]KVA75393.1 protocatechuate 3,4-dioxygenase subunit beta [Burkholderia ubonensis]KVC75687.1 protocatechuate 3,4-dioxygenase subunit beta [Burkholderia ubonensis]KVC88331.1 protocatechuate 3,4-dioxygenase subunit beta [Burkholderia ubonensis]KVC94556.1 protocatechuate 3,4-dioxygenase subunit beta [Burkholderia ubonensis]KVD07063.1 protocatechuate 3,4-dioxygenase subunit beta [Burkholderia ubonensis]
MDSPTILTPRDWPSHPAYIHPEYRSSVKRGPTRPLIPLKEKLRDQHAPVYGAEDLGALDHDLTKNAVKNGEPLGERIVVTGRVLDEGGKPVRNTLVEVWQANAAGRYVHKVDQHDAPLDPNFLGAGRCLTDDEGRYRFLTIKPGAYPWGNHPNAWRPNHIHFSLFGDYFGSRLVTQMYFPGDPLLAYDPIFQGTPEAARDRLISRFSLDITEEGYALGYEFDIVLRGRDATPMER